MADSQHSASTIPQPVPAERELIVDIRPYGSDRAEFYGTRAQLEAEGIVPAGTEWPRGKLSVSWEAGAFCFVLKRRRPSDAKGPPSVWTSGDWWSVDWEPLSQPSWEVREIRRMTAELAAAVHRNSPEARRRWCVEYERRNAADKDQAFQRFKALVPALVPPPRRTRSTVGKAAGA